MKPEFKIWARCYKTFKYLWKRRFKIILVIKKLSKFFLLGKISLKRSRTKSIFLPKKLSWIFTETLTLGSQLLKRKSRFLKSLAPYSQFKRWSIFIKHCLALLWTAYDSLTWCQSDAPRTESLQERGQKLKLYMSASNTKSSRNCSFKPLDS